MVLVGMCLTPGELNELWNETDTDGSGVIDLQEFAALVKASRGQNAHTVESSQDKAIAEAFRKFDTDASGKLERQEFEKAMVLVRLTPGELNDLWNETDTDGSGVIDLQEFAVLVKGIHAGGSQEQQRQHHLNKQQPKEIAVTSAFNSSTPISGAADKSMHYIRDVPARSQEEQRQDQLHKHQPKEIAVTSAFNNSALKPIHHRSDVLAIKTHQQQQHSPQNATSDALHNPEDPVWGLLLSLLAALAQNYEY